MFIGNLQQCLVHINIGSLKSIENEISAYDPNNKFLVDASTLRRIMAKHYKSIPLDSNEIQELFQKFAVNPKTCREIKYGEMMEFFKKLKKEPIIESSAKLQCNYDTNNKHGCNTAQSPNYHRGDAKLIADMNNALKMSVRVPIGQTSEIRQKFALLDRGRLDTLSREQIIDVLKDAEIFTFLDPLLDQIFHRCNANSNQYDWSTFADFLEKACKNGESNGHAFTDGSTEVLKKAYGHALNREAGFQKPHANVVTLIEHLTKLDPTDSGYIFVSQAHAIVQKYCNVHQLGMDPTIVKKFLCENLNETGTKLNLKKFAENLLNY